MSAPAKAIGMYFGLSFLFTSILTVVVFIAIVIFGFFFVKNAFLGGSLYTNVNQLKNEDFGDLDDKADIIVRENDDGLNALSSDVHLKREKVYVAYNKKKKSNYVIAVYKAKYSSFYKDTSYTIYVPIQYENLKKDWSSLIFKLDNGKVVAPEYYFNDEHSEYSYGYQDMNSLEKEVIEPLKKDYEVTQK